MQYRAAENKLLFDEPRALNEINIGRKRATGPKATLAQL